MPKRKIVTTQAELNTLPEEMRADILELSDPCRFGDVTYVTISVPENQGGLFARKLGSAAA